MAFYEVYREDENGYASAIVRAHGVRQAVNALTHLGFTQDNSVAERIPDGRSEPVKILATVEERSAPEPDDSPVFGSGVIALV
ncbi:hypothetical protein AB0958_21910 [Streptomyces sp. NPDC006655]|uniref:hypothetical protein n=1 Tax=Streptomyces sp. NPDC006655 TaxID=3156898 RepID=UPI003455F1C0